MNATVVCFHAHPDDEALLMGGTIARLAAEGHRVVLVTATAGERGLAAADVTRRNDLGDLRAGELQSSARLLGCARVVMLGYPDSGSDAGPEAGLMAGGTFATTAVEDAARRLCEVLVEENAAVLTIYDPAGGYGHPDHVQVHRVGKRAAELAHTTVVLEVTVDRQLLQRALRLIRLCRPKSPDFEPSRFDNLFTDRARITHKVDVRAFLPQKRAAMQAHSSQATGDAVDRSLAWFLRLPPPMYRLAFGREWFVEHDRMPPAVPLDDILATLR